ncbi:MAG: prepilin-type N-terminal cleavage/methylation domain-containing protein, partial [Candidatus Nanopelagicales bacterium]|nr:prepilin-type N-terminal cleavage/methylation domain-containing protein [Candidatus Nanopelagicales bacterium]
MFTRILRKRQEEEGFTLIELLVVIIIIGILAAIAIPVFLNQRNNAYNSAVKSDISTLATAEISYFTNNGVYVICAAAACGTTAALNDNGFRQSPDNNYTTEPSVVTVTAVGAAGGTTATGFCADAQS